MPQASGPACWSCDARSHVVHWGHARGRQAMQEGMVKHESKNENIAAVPVRYCNTHYDYEQGEAGPSYLSSGAPPPFFSTPFPSSSRQKTLVFVTDDDRCPFSPTFLILFITLKRRHRSQLAKNSGASQCLCRASGCLFLPLMTCL